MNRAELFNKAIANKFAELQAYFESGIAFNDTLKTKINALETFKSSVISKRSYGSLESFWNANNQNLQACSKLQNEILAEVLEHIEVFNDLEI